MCRLPGFEVRSRHAYAGAFAGCRESVNQLALVFATESENEKAG
ncbi:hypothetical protein BSIN_5206 [Burkholderia singularis]|uniref:Uncharacterized protein n=1 Tax=Burkholderia singularis TaxID=1503053 RepID=A0A238HCR1_9BURK|nr:hypothetical protein BSIN_5206 [Burkholderia singularis]